MEYIVEFKGNNSIRTAAYEVRMREGTVYKRAEMVIAQGENPQAAAQAQIDSLWANGEVVSGEWFIASQQRALLPLYKGAQMAAQQTLMVAGELNAMNAAAAQVLAGHDAILAGWTAYREALEAANGGGLTPLELHLAMMLYTVIGRQAGGG